MNDLEPRGQHGVDDVGDRPLPFDGVEVGADACRTRSLSRKAVVDSRPAKVAEIVPKSGDLWIPSPKAGRRVRLVEKEVAAGAQKTSGLYCLRIHAKLERA